MSALVPIRRHLPHAIAVAVALAGLAAPAMAKRAPDPASDTRMFAAPAPHRQIESAGPVRTIDGSQSRYGVETGVLRRYWRLAPGSAAHSVAAPRQVALGYLQDHATELGLRPDRLEDDLALAYEKSSPSGTHLRWNQVVGGVPVWRSEIVVKVAPGGDIASVHNNLRGVLRLATSPVFSAERAVEMGVAAIGPTGRALGTYRAELYVIDLETGARLAYRVNVPNERPMGDWIVWVDARTGAVFGVEDQMVYVNGTGRVFDPDPESKTGITNLPDNADGDAGIPFPGAYDIRTLLDITNTAGTYSLSGPYARIIDFESPVIPAITATDPNTGFDFQRAASAFEDVNVYFQIDNIQRYIQSLGFINVNNRIQELDTHGFNGADNSHYLVGSRQIAYGEGGVDDAEDADVVLHEYGHAIQHDVVRGWGGGQEGAMGEGFGDYIAGSYSLALYPSHEPNFMFNWDGHNEFWPGRLLRDFTLHYPEDCCGEVHDAGTLWCSGLIDAWYAVGRTVMDRLVLDHHFALGSTATMADAANQVIQSDIDLYGGAHVATLVTIFDTWGFVDAGDFIPSITHTPLGDTENTAGPYVVTAVITAAQPLDPTSLKVHYGTTGSFTNELTLTPTGNPNEYSASIPGPLSNVDVRYYLTASDINGGTSTHPLGAPGSFHEFHVGADTEAPVIVHTPIGFFPQVSWPGSVSATVTDNLGVNPASVQVAWSKNAVPQTTFTLTRVGLTDQYTASFPGSNGDVAVGDQIAYRISAADLAGTPNTTTHPTVGDHTFPIIASRGLVLVLDDDEVARSETVKTLSEEDAGKGPRVVRNLESALTPGPAMNSANSIAAVLNQLGFTATVEVANSSNPATWSGYGVLISASGGSEAPVANAPYRAALEAYVAGGGKLIVEGGEVVFDAASSPGYPSFAANVLHSIDWDADNAGPLRVLPDQSAHPIARTPNTLPASLPIAYTGFGSEDSYKAVAPAYVVYGVTAQAGNAGILVYDPTPSPQSAQIVVLGFDWKDVGDLATRTNLIENTVEYLLRPEGAATGSISGRVILAGGLDNSGATVKVLPGGATFVTDATGQYSFSGLYALGYDVSATKTGYAGGLRSGVVVNAGSLTANQNFILYPTFTLGPTCLNPGTAIPDNVPAGITSDMNIAQAFAVQSVSVSVNIPHTFIGDLIVELRHGLKTVRLHNRSGGSADNLVRNYPVPNAVDGPGSLTDFVGDPSNGIWTLFVSDNAGADLGNLAQWCLTLQGADLTQVTGVEDGASTFTWLAAGRPNPVGANGTTLTFALAQRGKASLVLYDVAGREVRTLLDGSLDAGEHRVKWDARDAAGRAVPGGVYLYRLRAAGFESTRRLVVVR